MTPKPAAIPLKIQRRRIEGKGHPLILVDEEHGRKIGLHTHIDITENINGQCVATVRFINVRLALDEEYEG